VADFVAEVLIQLLLQIRQIRQNDEVLFRTKTRT